MQVRDVCTVKCGNSSLLALWLVDTPVRTALTLGYGFRILTMLERDLQFNYGSVSFGANERSSGFRTHAFISIEDYIL